VLQDTSRELVVKKEEALAERKRGGVKRKRPLPRASYISI
jgi:hypothetical protein